MDIVKMFADGLKKVADERDAWDDRQLHISDLGVASSIDEGDRKCPRALWYRLQGEKPAEITDGQRLMFHQGHNLEDIVYDCLLREIKELPLDGTVPTLITRHGDASMENGISGTYDLCIRTADYTYIVDVKTRRGAAFRYGDGPKPAEKLQVLGYMYALGQSLQIEPERLKGMILEVDREGQNFARCWQFDYDKETVEKAVDELLAISEAKEPPEGVKPWLTRKVNKGKDSLILRVPWQCSHCPFKDGCCDCCPDEEMFARDKRVVGKIDDEMAVFDLDGLDELEIR